MLKYTLYWRYMNRGYAWVLSSFAKTYSYTIDDFKRTTSIGDALANRMQAPAGTCKLMNIAIPDAACSPNIN